MLALPALVLIPFIGGLLAWLAGLNGGMRLPRFISVLTVLLMGVLLIPFTLHGQQGWMAQFLIPWIPAVGINCHLSMDGLSLIMLWLNVLIALPCILLPCAQVKDRGGLFQCLLLMTVAGMSGVFLATDLMLFFFFWEMMLLPMFALIIIWGDENRGRAALKFFMFTQGSGLLMMLSMIGLVLLHQHEAGVVTFDYADLAGTAASSRWSYVLMLGFFIAFAVKLPMVPLHAWLPDTYASAPIPATLLLSGVMAKTGGYGLIRFVWELFPSAAPLIAPVAMTLGVIGLIYCAWIAFAQNDLKRLIAYSSVSHLGFILLGIFSGTKIGLEGAVIQMVAHGLSTGALFIMAGLLEDRLQTRDMGRMGGLWPAMPQFSGLAMLFAAASLGLPGLGNFIGEFLTLLGTWSVSHTMAIISASALVLSSVYSLTMMLRIFYGPKSSDQARPLGPVSYRHVSLFGGAAALLIALGVYPQPVLDRSNPALPEMARIAQEQQVP